MLGRDSMEKVVANVYTRPALYNNNNSRKVSLELSIVSGMARELRARHLLQLNNTSGARRFFGSISLVRFELRELITDSS